MMYYIENINNLMNLRISPYLIILLLEVIIDNIGIECATQAEINNHLELGRQFLSKGQLADALTHYHAAVEGDPNNYLTYFKRGTVYLALGKARLALADLDRTIHLKPDFLSARLSRGSVYLKLCDLERAQVDFNNVLLEDGNHLEAHNYLQTIVNAETYKANINAHYANDNYHEAIMYLNGLLEICPWSARYRKFRADCHKEVDNYQAAVSDLRAATRLESDNTEGYLELSKLLYELGDASGALKEIRECLKLDPDHKECFPFYKKIKKVEKYLSEAEHSKQHQQYVECGEHVERALKIETKVNMIMFVGKQLLCTCLTKSEQQTSEAIKACGEALQLNKELSTYCDRAEAYLQAEMYDDAIRDYHAALELEEDNQRAKEGLQKAKKLQAQSERRDYYKILGVKRTATKREITKAYRKAAQKWHPDNFQSKSDNEKKLAEKKFIDIAAAKEVLTDDEKRAQFDNGEDPLDPEQNSNKYGGNPFHHFHQGSAFNFRFHFN